MANLHEILANVLGESDRAFSERVRGLYGKDVRIESDESGDPYLGGFSGVANDGTPTVTLNPTSRFLRETFIHELFHLKMRKEGYPNYRLSISAFLNAGFIGRVFSDLKETILHFMFFPEMRAMGLNPNALTNSLYKHSLDSGKIDDNPNPQARALTFMRMTLECADNELLDELTRRFEANGWNESIKAGRELAQLVVIANPTTPDAMVQVRQDCANLLFNEVCTFDVSDTETKTKGDFIETVLVISVVPT